MATEKECLYPKEFTCPVCGKKFKQPVVKVNRSRILRKEDDLRPVYAEVDATKYDVLHCNHCGHTALSRYFVPLAEPYKKLVLENISKGYVPLKSLEETVTYEQALVRYRMAYADAMVRNAKNSEKGVIFLRTAWVLRGLQEELRSRWEAEEEELLQEYDSPQEFEQKLEEFHDDEETNRKRAWEMLMKARAEETPPVAGMDEITLDYLLAVLSARYGDINDAFKLLHEILVSKKADKMKKEKARDLMYELKERS